MTNPLKWILMLALPVLFTSAACSEPRPVPVSTATPTVSAPTAASGVADAARGQTLAQANACAACHSTNGNVSVGPTWAGLFGKEETLEDGTTVLANDVYLRESILDPNAKIVKGFSPGIMPQDFRSRLSDTDVDAIIAFIKTLSG